MPLLKATAFDLSIAHPWVPPSRFRLNSFRHKGYWYHGKSRELRTMQLFAKLIRPNDTVAEVGGHIGFISMFFAKLVGDNGRVVVFEPGSNNLPYLRQASSCSPTYKSLSRPSAVWMAWQVFTKIR